MPTRNVAQLPSLPAYKRMDMKGKLYPRTKCLSNKRVKLGRKIRKWVETNRKRASFLLSSKESSMHKRCYRTAIPFLAGMQMPSDQKECLSHHVHNKLHLSQVLLRNKVYFLKVHLSMQPTRTFSRVLGTYLRVMTDSPRRWEEAMHPHTMGPYTSWKLGSHREGGDHRRLIYNLHESGFRSRGSPFGPST